MTIKEEITQAIKQFCAEYYIEQEGEEHDILLSKILAVVDEKVGELKERCNLEHEGWVNSWGADLISNHIIDEIFGDVQDNSHRLLGDTPTEHTKPADTSSGKTENLMRKDSPRSSNDSGQPAPFGVLTDEEKRDIVSYSGFPHAGCFEIVNRSEQAVLKKVEEMIDEIQKKSTNHHGCKCWELKELRQKLRGKGE